MSTRHLVHAASSDNASAPATSRCRYLDKALPKALGQPAGKINIAMESPSLIKRHQMEVSSKLRVNATSSDMSNADIGDVMAGLETHFKNYEDRIVNNTYTSPAPIQSGERTP